ncbi:uncharacterized protein B0I36DRAFT_326339 [Microdochium trichocladiopsis]|uniref:Secreted protein n=1 Tax=Microdochium trichocladiopsis TaxID=1682393 RepID=A0A9P8Y7U5_9PEZI|nr:uncharacterized protein B0I36DRAFT_326339 [Microdochium trichocladiopsis]KAH7029766.1 hypothetical protein B0I36DRAFT_326339 [Microdochium trichocladiopsis]
MHDRHTAPGQRGLLLLLASLSENAYLQPVRRGRCCPTHAGPVRHSPTPRWHPSHVSDLTIAKPRVPRAYSRHQTGSVVRCRGIACVAAAHPTAKRGPRDMSGSRTRDVDL